MSRRFTNPLSRVIVAAPCSADWNEMFGNDRVRLCGQCNLNVYNLSAMSRGEAETLITGTEGLLCISFYRRKDGSIITDNCPVGLRALRRRASKIRQAVVSAGLGCLGGIGVHFGIDGVKAVAFVPQRTAGMVLRQDPDTKIPPTQPTGSSVKPIKIQRRPRG